MKKIFTKEFYIGLSVIVAITVLIVGIDYLKGINLFKPANFYVAHYSNVAGLEISAPITINGYKVGQVREINFDYSNPDKPTEVVLALDKNLQLPEGSVATIGSSLMSGSYVTIRLGSSSRRIPVGGEIATASATDLMASLESDLMPKVSVALAHVDSLVMNLNTLVADPAIARSIGRLDGITGNLLASSGGLDATLNRDVPLIMRKANGICYNIDTITANLADLSEQLRRLPLSETLDNVNATVANLEAFSAQLKNPDSSLGKIMNDPELYNRMNRVAADVDSLIVDIKRNPKRYISIKLL